MSILQERLLLVLGHTGRVGVGQSGLMHRLQERWPTEHGYAAQVVEAALKALEAAGTIHCSPAGKWTRFLNLSREKPPSPEPAAANPIAPSEADSETTQEIQVSKTKVCTGKCGKEKPIGEFYANCSACKRCTLDRQKELKAAKAKGAKPSAAAPPIGKPKPAAKRNGNGAAGKDLAPMIRPQYQLVIFDTAGDKHEFMVDLASLKRLQAELQEVA